MAEKERQFGGMVSSTLVQRGLHWRFRKQQEVSGSGSEAEHEMSGGVQVCFEIVWQRL